MSVVEGERLADAASRETKVWDVAVRLFHWSLAVGFFTAYFTDDDLLWLHVWAGYAVGGLVALRIVWGLIGTQHARFSDFFFGHKAVFAYLRDLGRMRAPRYVGHSPAGAAMVFALLAGLTGLVGAGLAFYAVRNNAGPLAGMVTVGDRRTWQDIHELFANGVLALVIAHVAGVVWASLAHGENLVRAMVTGRKEQRPGDVMRD